MSKDKEQRNDSESVQPHGRGGARLMEAEKPKLMWPTLWRVITYLKKYTLVIIFAMIASVAVSLLTIYNMRLMGVAIDDYIANYNPSGLLRLSILMATIFLTTSLLTYVEIRLMNHVSQTVSAKLREDLYDSFLLLPLRYFDEHSSGDLMSRLTNDVDNVNQTLSSGLSSLLEAIVNIIAMFIAMLVLSPFLTMWAMLVLPLTFLSTKIVVSFSRRFFKKLQEDLGETNGYIEEMLSAQKMLILYDQQNTTQDTFKTLNEKLCKSYHHAQTLSALGPLMSFINNFVYFLVTVVAAYMIISGGSMTVGILFTFLMYMRRFANPLNEIASLFNTIQSAVAGAERIFEVMDETPERKSSDSPYQYKEGNIQYDHVYFHYSDDNEVLHDIDFNILANSSVALVGATGSGKTTIASLLNRFYDPSAGQVLIDGQETSNLTQHSIRRKVGLVLQDTFLFTDTVLENIRYGRPDSSREEAIAAAESTGANRFIEQLELGYDTIIEENGASLSQGQRQLLAISRAILVDAPVLILDEATSSIDTQTEQEVQASLRRLSTNKTTLIIAHRLSTIQNADYILVIDNGRIIEKGNHKELLELNNVYAKMHHSQFAKNFNIYKTQKAQI